MLQQMWEAVGVEVDFECVESGVYYDQLDQGDFEICRYGYSDRGQPDSVFGDVDNWYAGSSSS